MILAAPFAERSNHRCGDSRPGPVRYSRCDVRSAAKTRPRPVCRGVAATVTSLWEAADACLEDVPAAKIVDILDIIHVAGYVRLAAKAFHPHQEQQEAFCRERMLRILQGDTEGVIHGLRVLTTRHGLRGQARKDVQKVCNYFKKNRHRMRYDEYLREGYPIATGVIEGACRHLVKDRMERTGMRWCLEPTQAMLSLRAVFQTPYWQEFHHTFMSRQQARLHPHRRLIDENYSLPA